MQANNLRIGGEEQIEMRIPLLSSYQSSPGNNLLNGSNAITDTENDAFCNCTVEEHYREIFAKLMETGPFEIDLYCHHSDEVCKFIPPEIGYNLLHVATIQKNITNFKVFISKFKYFLNFGQKSTKTVNPGMSALHLAAQVDFPESIPLLLSLSPNIDELSENGLTPLQVAAFFVSTDTARCLIEKGAKLNNLVPKNVEKNLTTLSLVLNRIPKAANAIEEQLDASITMTMDNPFELNSVHILNFDFTKWQIDNFQLMYDFATEAQNSNLIMHPLLTQMVDVNWKSVRFISYLRLALAIYFALAISAFGALPSEQVIPFLLTALILELVRKVTSIISFLTFPSNTINFKTLKNYFLTYQNLAQCVSIFGATIFCLGLKIISFEAMGPLVFLASWMDCMFLIRDMPFLGLKFDIVFSVMKKFFILFQAFGLFLVGFVIVFWMHEMMHDSFIKWLSTIASLHKMYNMGLTSTNATILVAAPTQLPVVETGYNCSRNATGDLDSSSFDIANKSLFSLLCIVFLICSLTIVLSGLIIGQVVELESLTSEALTKKYKRKAIQIKYYHYTWSKIKFIILKWIHCSNSERMSHFIASNGSRVKYHLPDRAHYPDFYHKAYEIASVHFVRLSAKNMIFDER